MSDPLQDAFEVCLAALSTGVNLEACLSLYPDLAGELRPYLETAQLAQQAADRGVPAMAMSRSRAKMLRRAGELRSTRGAVFARSSWMRLALASLALVLVLLLSLNGLVVASAKSLPGDALYSVKRAAENVSLKLAPSVEARQKIAKDYQQRRTEEIRSLLTQNLVRSVSLEGVIDQIADGQMVIEGIPVVVGADTKLSGELQPRRLVKVEGTTQPGGFIAADQVQLRFYELAGEVAAIESNSWVVGGTRYNVLDNTHIDPTLKIGDRVLVLVYASDDGSLYAQAILRIPESFSASGSGSEPFKVEFSGTVEAISGDTITVDGKTVQITDQTELKTQIAIGTVVKVQASVMADGSLMATEIGANTTSQPESNVNNPEQNYQKDDGNVSSGDDDGSNNQDDSQYNNADSSSDDHSGEDSSGSYQEDNEDKSGSSEYKSSDDDHSGDGEHEDDHSEDHSGSGTENKPKEDDSHSEGSGD